MLTVTDRLASDYQVVIAGAPGIDHDYYEPLTRGHHVTVLRAGQTYQLLYNAHTALVTSGTATLETALFGVPQVVCYATALPRLVGMLRKIILKVKYVSLVNLIAGREVVPELVADGFSVTNLERHLKAILQGPAREEMLRGYEEVMQRLKPSHDTDNPEAEESSAPENVARILLGNL
jgi:lipid-A-disaccharide synthase